MSVNEIDTFVLLFPNEEWSDTATDAQLNSVVAQLQPNISYFSHLEDNLQTLSINNADRDGTISGFLYVPDLSADDECHELSKEFLPKNVTRQANLPPTDFTLVAIAPWINAECTISYLQSAKTDPTRGFIFYLPDNSTLKPPPPSSVMWDLGDGGGWKNDYLFPVYAVPGYYGFQLVYQLSLYSGNMTNVPHGHEIAELPGIDPRDYVRLYTELDVSTASTLPSFWVFLVVVMAVLVIVLGFISALMHLIQRARRKSLRQRVERGEVDLEALGIKRLTIPESVIARLPLFTYSAEAEKSLPSSPGPKSVITESEDGPLSPRSETETHYTFSTDGKSPPQLVVVNGTASPESIIVHKFLPYSQPTCPICLEDFVSEVSEIRELPCGHIFHPDCIDVFLSNNSSLCPMCKKSALPVGYCPIEITNAMVQRERKIRQLRSRVTVHDDSGDLEMGIRQTLRANLTTMFNTSTTQPQMPHQPQPVFIMNTVPRRQEGARLSQEPSREQIVEQRIRELTARRVPIRDPDLLEEQSLPKWRKTLARAFPGF